MERASRAIMDAFRKLPCNARRKVRRSMLYLRWIGFGFGFRYTLADVGALPKAPTSGALVKTLDELDNYQRDIAATNSWLPDIQKLDAGVGDDDTDGSQSAKVSTAAPRPHPPG